MGQKSSGNNQSSVVGYIRNQLYDIWKTERARILQPKWQRNIDAFNRCATSKFWKTGETKAWRSNTFTSLTKTKVLAAYSLLIDILLQNGSIPFTMEQSPWDDMVTDTVPAALQHQTESQIDDAVSVVSQQFCDCHADRQLMKGVMSAAIYGEAWSKRYIHDVKRWGYNAVSMAPQGLADPTGKFTRYEPFTRFVTSPGIEYVSLWNLFRDLETEDIKAGRGVIQRELASPYSLRQLEDDSLANKAGIEAAIASASAPGKHNTAPTTAALPPGQRQINHRFNTIEMLECWVRIPVNVFEEYIEELGATKRGNELVREYDVDNIEISGHEVNVMALIADDEIVRFAPIEPDSNPFYRMVWEDKLDHVEATGVADNVEVEQVVGNGMQRAYEDNLKLSGNVILATKRQNMQPGALDDGIYPGIEIELADDIEDARKAIQQIIIQNVGATILEGLGINERHGDESSQIPRLSQGFTPEKQKPNTAFELDQLLTNAGKYIGGGAKNVDEGWVEPWVNDFHRYNMADPEQTKGKGNYIGKALGYTSFQDRIVKNNNLKVILQAALGSEALLAETKIDVIFRKLIKGMDESPQELMKSPEEKNTEAEAKANDPMVQLQKAALELDVENKKYSNEKVDEQIGKLNAETQKIFKKMADDTEDLKIERTRVINEGKAVEIKAREVEVKAQDVEVKARDVEVKAAQVAKQAKENKDSVTA